MEWNYSKKYFTKHQLCKRSITPAVQEINDILKIVFVVVVCFCI